MALQNATYANSGEAYYGNPADWYKFPSLNDKIEFAGTAAVLEVFPAIPDANTTISFNGNQIAYVSDIPNVSDWAQYDANHDVNILDPYVLNVSTINSATTNISTLVTATATISTLTVSTLNYSFPPIGNISTLLGPTVSVTADQGIFTLSPSEIALSTVNGSYGKISLTANPGQLNTLGGQVNVTANGGNSLGGLFGAVNIVANQGTDIATGITTGGEINITANSGTGLGTATSAININSGGINSYAGFGTPIASLYGYNFINGTAGVSLCASVVPNSAFQVPGTCYLYGDSGITLGSDTYGTRIFPYWNGLTAPPNLEISGRTTIAGTAEVVLSNVSSINGIKFPPVGSGVTSLNTLVGDLTLTSADNTIGVTSAVANVDLSITRDPQFSTITMKSVDVLTGEGTINGGALSALANQPLIITGGRSDPDYSLINMGVTGIITINGTNAEGLTNGEGIVISKEGATLTFPTFTDGTPTTFGCGEIFNLSTINGLPYNPGGGGSYPPNANFSTITMEPNTGIINANGIINPDTNGNDFTISQQNATGLLSLTVAPSAGVTVGDITINNAGSISFNEIVAGQGIQINPEGNILTFLQSATPADQGQIVGLSTINGISFPPPNSAFVDSFQIYVAPNGNDTTGNGSQQNPFLSIARAITERASITATTEVTIVLSSGTYNETFTLTRNTYLVGIQTGEARQPCNVAGTITMSDIAGGSIGLSGLEINGTVSMTGVAGLVFSVFGCNISGGASNAMVVNSGTLFLTESRLSSTGAITMTSATAVTIRDCVLTQFGEFSIFQTSGGNTVIRQCSLTSSSTSATASALVRFTNTGNAFCDLGFNRIEYTSNTTDTGGNKCCIQFAGSGFMTASVFTSLLLCQGATTGSGGQIQCIQDVGAGGVNISYGQLIAGATAHHISPNATKTAYNVVP